MEIKAYSVARALVDSIIAVLKADVDNLAFVKIRDAFSGDMYDNPTLIVTVAVGPHQTKIEKVLDPETKEQTGWLMTASIFADIAMPVMQSTCDAWHTYMHIVDDLSVSSVGDALVSSECGTPEFDRNSRAFITRTKFTFELSV